MRKDCEIEINYIANNCIVVIKDLRNISGSLYSFKDTYDILQFWIKVFLIDYISPLFATCSCPKIQDALPGYSLAGLKYFEFFCSSMQNAI